MRKNTLKSISKFGVLIVFIEQPIVISGVLYSAVLTKQLASHRNAQAHVGVHSSPHVET